MVRSEGEGGNKEGKKKEGCPLHAMTDMDGARNRRVSSLHQRRHANSQNDDDSTLSRDQFMGICRMLHGSGTLRLGRHLARTLESDKHSVGLHNSSVPGPLVRLTQAVKSTQSGARDKTGTESSAHSLGVARFRDASIHLRPRTLLDLYFPKSIVATAQPSPPHFPRTHLYHHIVSSFLPSPLFSLSLALSLSYTCRCLLHNSVSQFITAQSTHPINTYNQDVQFRDPIFRVTTSICTSTRCDCDNSPDSISATGTNRPSCVTIHSHCKPQKEGHFQR